MNHDHCVSRSALQAGTNHPIPTIGQIVEVRYLYAYPGGSLFQPVYLGARDDISCDDCKMTQLKFKSSEGNER